MQLGIRNVASVLLLSVVACATDHERMGPGRDADILLERLHQAGNFSGAVIIGHNGEIVYENAFGNADKTHPFTPDTAADGASLAKTVTAALIWRLIDAGTIALDDPVQDHVAEFPYAAVTIEHLLSHSSGALTMMRSNRYSTLAVWSEMPSCRTLCGARRLSPCKHRARRSPTAMPVTIRSHCWLSVLPEHRMQTKLLSCLAA
jgi:Beta-lactamase